MPDIKNRKIILLFSGLAFFAVVLILGANMLLKLVGEAPKPEGSALPPIQADTSIKIQAPGGTDAGREGPVYEIKSGAPDDRPVLYTTTGFSPRELTIRASDIIGCVITIANKSGAPLRVRVGPHDPAGDPGADYGVIASGETGILGGR